MCMYSIQKSRPGYYMQITKSRYASVSSYRTTALEKLLERVQLRSQNAGATTAVGNLYEMDISALTSQIEKILSPPSCSHFREAQQVLHNFPWPPAPLHATNQQPWPLLCPVTLSHRWMRSQAAAPHVPLDLNACCRSA
jgi:hypothetical protein